MKKIKFHTAVLFVENITESKQFYENILEMEEEYNFGTNLMFKEGLSLWQVGENHEIKVKLINTQNNSSNRNELYFESSDIEAVYRKVVDNDIKLFHTLKEESWGQKTFRFFDPDNHLIEIGETLVSFVTRLSEQMSVNQVSEKTGIKTEDILEIIKK